MADDPPEIATTTTALLGGRLELLQPERGYRVAIDPMLLAAAVPARKGERVLDVGAGTGAAALALARRIDGVVVEGIEVEPGFLNLSRRSAELNGLGGRVTFRGGDVAQPPADITADGFDHVMSNPPYIRAGDGRPPPDSGKRSATVEGTAPLSVWVSFCQRVVRTRGTVTLIHRADRLDEIIAALAGWAGGIVVFPLWPGGGEPGTAAGRVIVQARKGVRSPAVLAAGLTLHEPGGVFTAAATAVLEDGIGLDLRSALPVQ